MMVVVEGGNVETFEGQTKHGGLGVSCSFFAKLHLTLCFLRKCSKIAFWLIDPREMFNPCLFTSLVKEVVEPVPSFPCSEYFFKL